jgi:hypothetical protein
MKREDTGNGKRKDKIALCGELALEEAVNFSLRKYMPVCAFTDMHRNSARVARVGCGGCRQPTQHVRDGLRHSRRDKNRVRTRLSLFCHLASGKEM